MNGRNTGERWGVTIEYDRTLFILGGVVVINLIPLCKVWLQPLGCFPLKAHLNSLLSGFLNTTASQTLPRSRAATLISQLLAPGLDQGCQIVSNHPTCVSVSGFPPGNRVSSTSYHFADHWEQNAWVEMSWFGFLLLFVSGMTLDALLHSWLIV